MATLSRGQTFGATETVTNTKLHNLVDLGSVTSIVNSDIDSAANITDTKIADITTGGKVRGTAILNLPSIPSGAGLLPLANIPVLGSTYTSLVSIPNSSLLPLTLASWVDASAMRNIASMPSLAGQLPWYSISSSLASGAGIIFDGATKFVGGQAGSIVFISTTTLSAAASSGDIAITASKHYYVVCTLYSLTSTINLTLLFNNDSSGGNYTYMKVGRNASTGAIASTTTGADGIQMAANVVDGTFRTTLIFNITPDDTGLAGIIGTSRYRTAAGDREFFNIDGYYNGGTPTSFRITTTSGTITGTVSLFEIRI